MKRDVREFINELGNSIRVEVSTEDVEGVSGVKIYIAGPTSDTENLITRMEAEVIYEELGKVLRKTT